MSHRRPPLIGEKVTDRVDILMSSYGNCVAEAIGATSRSGMMLKCGLVEVAPAVQASHVTLGTRSLKRGCIPVSVTLFKENKLQRWRICAYDGGRRNSYREVAECR